MNIEILTIENCPHADLARARVQQAITATGATDITITHTRISDPGHDAITRFGGSPTILINGTDPFPAQTSCTRAGLTCRIYQTPDGTDRAPTTQQLTDAIESTRT